MQVENLRPEDVEQFVKLGKELRKSNAQLKMQIFHESKYERRKWKKKYPFSTEVYDCNKDSSGDSITFGENAK